MYFAVKNEENRVLKSFAYDTSGYSLALDTKVITGRQSWMWEHVGNRKCYEYLISIESDKPINIFEKHAIAVVTEVTLVSSSYKISKCVRLPDKYLPKGEIASPTQVFGFHSDMIVSCLSGVSLLNVNLAANVFAMNYDEALNSSCFCHYNYDYFSSYAPFDIDVSNFMTRYDSVPYVFWLPNKFAGDFAAIRAYGLGMKLFISTYKEDTEARIKVFVKQLPEPIVLYGGQS